MLRRLATALLAASLAAGAAVGVWIALRGDADGPRPPRPVIFVHGVSASAADIGTPGGQFHPLLPRIGRSFPRPGVCQRDAEPRPWEGSPCVFRYVGDRSLAGRPGAACPCDSQSGLIENAKKLAREVSEVAARAGDRVILVGYSMGGAIIRAYLGLFHERADRDIAAAVLVDPATTGSWAFAADPSSGVDDPLLEPIARAVARYAAARSGVLLERPAFRDLRPRSAAYRRVAAEPLPESVSTYTFWGDISLELSTGFLGIERAVEIGDVALLPGNPDPHALPPLGGQRFRPRAAAPGVEALEVAHTRTIEVEPADLGRLAGACVDVLDPTCISAARDLLDVPNAHSRVPRALDEIVVNAAALGGRMTLEDAVVAAVARNA